MVDIRQFALLLLLGVIVIFTIVYVIGIWEYKEPKNKSKRYEAEPHKFTLNEDEEAKRTGLGINEMRLFMSPPPPPLKIKSDEEIFAEVEDVKNRTKEVRLFGVKLLTITKDYRFNREEADSL